MNILFVGAHPDDIETFCGGTAALYAEQDHKVFSASPRTATSVPRHFRKTKSPPSDIKRRKTPLESSEPN